MKKLIQFNFTLFLLLSVFLIVGCDEDGPNSIVSPNGDDVSFIELRVTHNQIRGFEGDLRSERITAIARNAFGVTVPDAHITFGITNPTDWKGSLSAVNGDSTTNANGQLEFDYSIVITRSCDITIEALCSQVRGTTDISVQVADDIIGSISLEASEQVLAVPQNQTRQVDLTASLVDNDGNALSGMQVEFKTNPSIMGFVDSDTGTTDQNGQIRRKFNSIVDKYGSCEITASIGDYIGKATIEIRPVEAPAFISLSTITPVVKVTSGQNAIVELEAVVTDPNRVGVPGVSVAFEVLPETPGGVTFGSLSMDDSTDADGYSRAKFNSLGSLGNVNIKVRVLPSNVGGEGQNILEIQDEITLQFLELNDEIGTLTLKALPSFLTLPPDSNGMCQIEAQVRNINNNSIPNVIVDFTTNLGSLSDIQITNNSGIATGLFYNNYESGIASITASIPGTNFEAITEIIIRQAEGATGSLILNSDKTFIYADNGYTTAIITALLSDEDGQALRNQEIIFTKTHGTVNSPVFTDSLGIATALFRDVGLPSKNEDGGIEPALITARYNPLGIEASIEISIFEQNPVSNLTLQSSAEQMTAGSQDSTKVRAVCFLANGIYAPSGTLVLFETDKGSFSSEAVPVEGSFGIAETDYIAGNVVGSALLKAKVVNDDNVVYSNAVYINLIPGEPSRVTLNASPDHLITNNPDSYSTITAIVTDMINNPVREGTLVRFTTTLGNLVNTAVTNSDGHAITILTSGVEAGLAELTATVQTPVGAIEGHTTVTFVPGRPNSIELYADPLNIAVAGTGNSSTSTIRAEIKDANGNLVEGSFPVTFQLLNEPPEPQGCIFNDRGQVDSALTSNGVAVVSLNAGTQIGGKLIKAFTFRDEARMDSVQVILSTVAVVSGPPHMLDVDLNDSGEDANGGAWRIPVSARVYDIHRNPVSNNIPVIFSIEPDIATISNGFTGNVENGESEPGLAYSTLVYHSENTFSPITISATVSSPGGNISGTKEHKLPLQEGELEIHVDPANWRFLRNNPNDSCLHRVWVVLKDGHQIEINNAPILFTTDRARFYWMDHDDNILKPFFPNTARKFTGAYDRHQDEPAGTATVFLRGVMDDFFLDDIASSATVQIEAAVEGYPDVAPDPSFIYFTRR